VQILREDDSQGRRMLARSPQPCANRFVLVARDLFGRPQTSSAHHDQQRLGHLGNGRMETIHWRAFGFAKKATTPTAFIAPSSFAAAIANDVLLLAGRVGACGKG
jgi:hypothetical protein